MNFPINPINNKYKTMICRHYDSPQGCQIGDKCQFAHGSFELRNLDDPLPPQAHAHNFMQQVLRTPSLINYKASKCFFFERDNYCKYGAGCHYAHGDQDMRSSNDVSLLNTMATAMNCQLNMNYFENQINPVQMPGYSYPPIPNYPVVPQYNVMYQSPYTMMPNIDTYNTNSYHSFQYDLNNHPNYQYSNNLVPDQENFVKDTADSKGIGIIKIEPLYDNKKTKIDIVLQKNETVSQAIIEESKKQLEENGVNNIQSTISERDHIMKKIKKKSFKKSIKKENNVQKVIKRRKIHFIRKLKSQF